jgi:hypothetical protein
LQKGFQSNADLDGTYSCTTYNGLPESVTNGKLIYPPIQGCELISGFVYKQTGIMTFNSAAGTYTYSDWLNSRCGFFMSSTIAGNYLVRANNLLMLDTINRPVGESVTSSRPISASLTRTSPTSFTLGSESGLVVAECSKTAALPSPADGLTASVSGSSVALSWTIQGSDSTGFRVQYKTSSKGNWTTATVASASSNAFTVSGLAAGTYWFRVIATNGNGDAMSSSEVQGIVQ